MKNELNGGSKIYKYEIYNGERWEDARTYELYSVELIPKEEWDKIIEELFHKGLDAYDVYRELLKTDSFFKLEELICIETVAHSTIGFEFSTDINEWEYSNPDMCFRKKLNVYYDGTVEYRQDYLIL